MSAFSYMTGGEMSLNLTNTKLIFFHIKNKSQNCTLIENKIKWPTRIQTSQ